MQAGHGGDQAQAEAAARAVAAGFQADEALQHPLAVGFGDAGARIGDGKLDLVATVIRAPRHHRHRAARGRVLDGVVGEVGEGLGQQVAVAGDGQALAGLAGQRDPLVLGERGVELGNIGGEKAGVELRQVAALGPRFGLGDAQVLARRARARVGVFCERRTRPDL